MMELMCDTKHTFLAKVQSTKNIEKILIPPAIDIWWLTFSVFKSKPSSLHSFKHQYVQGGIVCSISGGVARAHFPNSGW